jgi:hypothetical protein
MSDVNEQPYDIQEYTANSNSTLNVPHRFAPSPPSTYNNTDDGTSPSMTQFSAATIDRQYSQVNKPAQRIVRNAVASTETGSSINTSKSSIIVSQI